MSRKRKLIDKKIFKLSQGCCRLCGESDPSTLDVHRITYGSEGGKYTKNNVVCLCVKCHRKVHDNQIKIIKYYKTTSAKEVLLIEENGKERFI